MKKKKIKILIADDDKDIIEILSYTFLQEGYRIVTASNGVEAIEKAKKELPDLIIIDIMMPRMDGMEAVSALRNLPDLDHVVIAFLSAASDDYLQVAGYNAGADDYITKPIKPKLLLSKIKALLRRQQILPFDTNHSNNIAGFEIFSDEYRIIRENRDIFLAKKEFELFCLLASNPGKVFKRTEILEKVWNNEGVGRRTIDVHILKLREKIGTDFFKSITGVGYKFEPIE